MPEKSTPTSNFSPFPASKVTSVSLSQVQEPPSPLGAPGVAAKPRRIPTAGPRSRQAAITFPLPLLNPKPAGTSPRSLPLSLRPKASLKKTRDDAPSPRPNTHTHTHPPHARKPQALRVPSLPWAEPQPTWARILQHRLAKGCPQRPPRPLPFPGGGAGRPSPGPRPLPPTPTLTKPSTSRRQ